MGGGRRGRGLGGIKSHMWVKGWQGRCGVNRGLITHMCEGVAGQGWGECGVEGWQGEDGVKRHWVTGGGPDPCQVPCQAQARSRPDPGLIHA